MHVECHTSVYTSPHEYMTTQTLPGTRKHCTTSVNPKMLGDIREYFVSLWNWHDSLNILVTVSKNTKHLNLIYLLSNLWKSFYNGIWFYSLCYKFWFCSCMALHKLCDVSNPWTTQEVKPVTIERSLKQPITICHVHQFKSASSPMFSDTGNYLDL